MLKIERKCVARQSGEGDVEVVRVSVEELVSDPTTSYAGFAGSRIISRPLRRVYLLDIGPLSLDVRACLVKELAYSFFLVGQVNLGAGGHRELRSQL